MDDFQMSSLNESKNEWGSRLISIFTPHIVDGLKSIFNESFKLCRENGEYDKYLMTFQNFLSRIPKWNPAIIENERLRIVENSSCNYLEDLITCVHIIQLKTLTAMRAGQKQKKIDITIPKLDDFIHKIYINVARKIYKNVYLFEINIQPLQVQKNNRELELMVQECILNTVRESIPIESILRAYMDETVEEDFTEEIKEQIIESDQPENSSSTATTTATTTASTTASTTATTTASTTATTTAHESVENIINKVVEEKSIAFNDIDYVKDHNNNESMVDAPKTFERLEEISQIRNQQRKDAEKEEEEEEEDNIKLRIFDQSASLDDKDIQMFESDKQELNLIPDLLLDDIEILV